MSERPIAGRIWAGWLRVTAQITADQDFEFICDIIREAVYFDFEGEHPQHDDQFDLTVGVCDSPRRDGHAAILDFPARVIVHDPSLEAGRTLEMVVASVRESITLWYQGPDLLTVRLGEGDEGRV